jgi:hypothetical protein
MEALVINDMSLFVYLFPAFLSMFPFLLPLTDSLSSGSIIRTTCDHIVEINVSQFEAELVRILHTLKINIV